jgi:diaminohydroxyphosphoribosylaminopyrimidine deaminase/5-amino-6-(5-phosphoribosylamino)uracil reductase
LNWIKRRILKLNEKWMKLALRLAKKGEGKVSPNPMVGAVLTKKEEVIATGYHRYFGGPHAEVEAIEKVEGEAQGTTLYVSLEPCNYYGKTPPCTEKIIQAGIKKVIAATSDPTSKGGLTRLAREGIETELGVCQEEAKKLNEAFFNYLREKRPFVIVKAAISLDGKIATPGGESKWITGEKSRRFAHSLRDKVDAILVGINTVTKDDPSLLEARLLNDQEKAGTFIFTTWQANKKRLEELKEKGIKVVVTEAKEEKVSLKKVLKKLGELEIMSLLVEGGGEVIASFFEEERVDKVFLFLASRIIGGKEAPTWVEGKGVNLLKETPYISIDSLKKIEGDYLLQGYVK